MQSNQTTTIQGPGAARINAAYSAAKLAEDSYVSKAIICGQMIQEECESIRNSHRGNCDNEDLATEESIGQYLKNECPEIPRNTAYRWMAAAARVMAILTETHHTNAVVWLELGGERYYASTVLTMPAADARPEILTFQQTFQHFLQDKTLAEVTRCALNGCDAAHNIERAANGKDKGGAGGNRRDYSKFIATHFKEIGNIFQKWDVLAQKDPAEFARMTESIRVTILGGPLRIEERGRPFDVKPWPKSIAQLMNGVLKERLRDE